MQMKLPADKIIFMTEDTENPKYEHVYILVDCNNFFASCERLVNPEYRNVPIVVLSNNDGCIVARSNEAKALGIKMGIPYFQVQDLIKKNHVKVFSSNFDLYLDISSRVMRALASISPNVIPYSVDEAFIKFDSLTEEQALDFGFQVKRFIKSNIGISVGVGIAQSKTLAKIASHHAKKHADTAGVYSLLNLFNRDKILRNTPISDVWGVGRRMNAHLTENRITTAYELAQCDPEIMRRHYSIVLARTIMELNAQDAISDDNSRENQQQIMYSRTFKDKLSDIKDIEEAVANYAAQTAQQLRSHQLYCSTVSVFLRTPSHGSLPKYENSICLKLSIPTIDTRDIIKAASEGLHQIFKKGYHYMSAGVCLGGLTANKIAQSDLFSYTPDDETIERGEKLMEAMDNLNTIHPQSISVSAQGHFARDKKFTDPKHRSQFYTIYVNVSPIAY